MTGASLIAASRESVLTTYVALASSVSGARLQHTGDYVQCSGPADLSFCNFAAGFDLGTNATEAGHRLVEMRNRVENPMSFWAFHMTGDQPAELPVLLAASGFEAKHGLAQLAWAPSLPGLGIEMEEAASEASRIAVARFMTDQFFWRMGQKARINIAVATAHSGLKLFFVGDISRPAGAVMLTETPMSIGLYNLCVEERHRNRGLGASIVCAVQHLAFDRALPVVLQCEGRLVAWYEKLGFIEVGAVTAYSMNRRQASDIL